MKNSQTKSNHNETKKQGRNGSTKAKQSPEEGLRELFVAELKDIYWAEKELTKALPKMIEKVSSEELASAMKNHLDATKGQLTRLEDVFSALGERAEGKKCEAIIGLIKEADVIMGETEAGVVRDAGIILAVQKIEHYEIATYGTLCSFAKTLGEDYAASLLDQTLSEEKEADDCLSEIAESSVNIEAAEE